MPILHFIAHPQRKGREFKFPSLLRKEDTTGFVRTPALARLNVAATAGRLSPADRRLHMPNARNRAAGGAQPATMNLFRPEGGRISSIQTPPALRARKKKKTLPTRDLKSLATITRLPGEVGVAQFGAVSQRGSMIASQLCSQPYPLIPNP